MTEAVYQEKILWRRAVFVIRSDAAGGLLSISALRREAADDIESALPPRGSRGAEAAEALRIYLDEPETLAPEKWLSEPVILSLPEAVQEVLRAVSRIPFSETAAAGDPFKRLKISTLSRTGIGFIFSVGSFRHKKSSPQRSCFFS